MTGSGWVRAIGACNAARGRRFKHVGGHSLRLRRRVQTRRATPV